MSRKRILIVEDDGIVAFDLESRLSGLGYEVVGRTASGADALAKVAAARPDLVLMDIMLRGDMDGVEAARTIVNQHRVPVVYLTAHADHITIEKARTTNPYGYILKPFDEDELRTTLELVWRTSPAPDNG